MGADDWRGARPSPSRSVAAARARRARKRRRDVFLGLSATSLGSFAVGLLPAFRVMLFVGLAVSAVLGLYAMALVRMRTPAPVRVRAQSGAYAYARAGRSDGGSWDGGYDGDDAAWGDTWDTDWDGADTRGGRGIQVLREPACAVRARLGATTSSTSTEPRPAAMSAGARRVLAYADRRSCGRPHGSVTARAVARTSR